MNPKSRSEWHPGFEAYSVPLARYKISNKISGRLAC
ncbi:hypothetical protein HWD31_gp03 [Pantoea phage vB_PagM_SSEM1]|uniref:Uncharacterized protein n=1 Tax=Pantoea phage vB_PagM_SSEM1 TaxID=2721760 RepID=A0A6H0DA55_9CAUD|nr:hypothetical protein HWD31_gp03 [Pantoea phage vB_PagM_SSEM1]QIS79383.1 hypothetical protein SSEM1_gp03 [Pantoea phage vB_PagM_SSEM1]